MTERELAICCAILERRGLRYRLQPWSKDSQAGGPIAVAVNERTGHAFVTNAGGVMRMPDFWGREPSWIRGWLPCLPHPSFRTRPVPASVRGIDTTR